MPRSRPETPERAIRERRARDDDVAPWREHGWVLLEGLVPAEGIDAAGDDLYLSMPFPGLLSATPEPGRQDNAGRPGADSGLNEPDQLDRHHEPPPGHEYDRDRESLL